MGFQTLKIKKEYRTFDNDIANEFYIPLLREAVLYKRAVGYFSSSVLLEISKGIDALVEKSGKIKLIVSPKLEVKDIEAIEKGYRNRDEIISKALLKEMKEPINYFEEERLNLLSHLVENGTLDIKIALTMKGTAIGMYHEKVGLLYDEDHNVIAFSGSMNETFSGLSVNYECIDVFTSWEDKERVISKETAFRQLWANMQYEMKVLDFPQVCIEKLKQYQKETYLTNIDELEQAHAKENKADNKENIPKIPENIKLHDYQKEAISNWSKQNFTGVFDMATGTGKTITALGAMCNLSEVLKHKLLVVIVCPYKHLVTQWVEDIERFNIQPIIAFSGGPDRKWKDKLDFDISCLNVGNLDFKCFITTNKTFSSEFVQEQLNRTKTDILLIADEVHNLGSSMLQASLNIHIKYRLGLSATINRHRDESGTQSLMRYFGEKCIQYTLEEAIEAGFLTRYYYYPIVVYLEEDEYLMYKSLTKKIAKCYVKKKNGTMGVNKTGEMLLLKRARLVASAKSKISKLEELLYTQSDESHLLIYCSDSRIVEDEEATEKQIDLVCQRLIENLEIRCARFTYTESATERELIKKEFDKGDYLKALVAIKCLDEGVNIPKIRKAFILASSSNPKEYIQRRGRVLRKFQGKEYAYIYDFVTLPRDLDYARYQEDNSADRGLVVKELQRINEFAKLAENYYDSVELISELQEIYDVYELEEEDVREDL